MKVNIIKLRFFAFCIDYFIISVFILLLGFFFINEEYTKEINDNHTELIEKYSNSEISESDYIKEMSQINYDLDYSNILFNIFKAVILIIYFVIFQFYNGGQTIGKKLMNIKIVSNFDKKLSLDSYFFRSIIIYPILNILLMVTFIMFVSSKEYFYISFALQILQYVLLFVTILMILIKKERGLHDILVNSKVIVIE